MDPDSGRYVVTVDDGGGWRLHRRTGDREHALDLAESLHASRRYLRVRVIERGRDSANTVFSRRHWRFEPAAWALIPVVLAGGVGAYFATRWALTTFALL